MEVDLGYQTSIASHESAFTDVSAVSPRLSIQSGAPLQTSVQSIISFGATVSNQPAVTASASPNFSESVATLSACHLAQNSSKFQDRDSSPLLVSEDFDNTALEHITLLAADLDKTLYPNGMGSATTAPSAEAKDHFVKNIRCFMDFMGHGRLAIPVTGNSPALAQQKFDRSGVTWRIAENPGVFCNGALVQGVNGTTIYSAEIVGTIMSGIERWLSKKDGFHKFEGSKYPFAVNCMTKSQVLFLPPGKPNEASQSIADGWASMQLMPSDTADPGFDWKSDPAYQVNLLLKSKGEFLNDYPDFEVDTAATIGRIQNDLLDDLEKEIGKLDSLGYQGKHVMAPWLETNIVQQGVNKGQSLNRFIHAQSVQGKIGKVSVGTHVMVAGDASNDLPMFLPWGQVDNFNGKTLPATEKPAVRMIMPDSEDEKLSLESNVKNKVYEVMEAVLNYRVVKGTGTSDISLVTQNLRRHLRASLDRAFTSGGLAALLTEYERNSAAMAAAAAPAKAPGGTRYATIRRRRATDAAKAAAMMGIEHESEAAASSAATALASRDGCNLQTWRNSTKATSSAAQVEHDFGDWTELLLASSATRMQRLEVDYEKNKLDANTLCSQFADIEGRASILLERLKNRSNSDQRNTSGSRASTASARA